MKILAVVCPIIRHQYTFNILAESVPFAGIIRQHRVRKRVFNILENNYRWVRADHGKCELQLGKRNLYPLVGAQPCNRVAASDLNWALNMADGNNDTISISNYAGIPCWEMGEILYRLESEGLIKRM